MSRLRATHPSTTLQLSALAAASVAVSALIVFGNNRIPVRVWAVLGLAILVIVVLWQLAKKQHLTARGLDQFAWAILISHTVIVSRVRDARLLAEERSITAGILAEISIWCLCLAYGLIRLSSNFGNLRALSGKSARYVTLFLILAVASSGYSVAPSITLAWCMKLTTIIVLSCVLLTPDDPLGSVRRFLRATYWGLLMMILQLILLGLLSPADAISRGIASGLIRLGGFILPATVLSPIAGLICILIVVDLFRGRPPRYWGMTLMVSGTLMLGSIGRAGILASVITMLMVLFYFRRIRTAVFVISLMLFAFMAFPELLNFSIEMITRKQTEPQILSLTGRVDLWEAAISLFAMKPILGWGYVAGSRIALMSAFRAWPAPHAHNAFLEILIDLGLIGAFALLASLISPTIVFIRLLRQRRRGSTDFPQIASLKMLAFLLLFTIDGMFTAGYGGAPRYESTILIGAAFSADLLRRQLGDQGQRSLANSDRP